MHEDISSAIAPKESVALHVAAPPTSALSGLSHRVDGELTARPLPSVVAKEAAAKEAAAKNGAAKPVEVKADAPKEGDERPEVNPFLDANGVDPLAGQLKHR